MAVTETEWEVSGPWGHERGVHGSFLQPTLLSPVVGNQRRGLRGSVMKTSWWDWAGVGREGQRRAPGSAAGGVQGHRAPGHPACAELSRL